MQGGLLAGEHQGRDIILCPHPIFRKRLRVEETGKKKSASRCLFGVPDPIESHNLLTKVQQQTCLDFGRKWNFDPVRGNPRNHVIMVESEAGEEEMEEDYAWTQVISQDEMAELNQHRFEVPLAPNTNPVTLLFAPSSNNSTSPSLRVEISPVPVPDSSPLNVSMESRSTDEEGNLSLNSSTSGHNTSMEPATPSPAPKRTLPPSLKQRCITGKELIFLSSFGT